MLVAVLSFIGLSAVPSQAISTGCTGVQTSFITGESLSNLSVSGSASHQGTVWSSATSELTFTYSNLVDACQQIQINFFNISNNLGLTLPLSQGGSTSTACDPGPAAGNGCYLQLDSTGLGRFTVAITNAADKSFQYILVGPGWSSGTTATGVGSISFSSSTNPTSTPTPSLTASVTPTPSSTPTTTPTPALVPSAPRNVVATRGNKSATISWIAPISAGASAITSYVLDVSSSSSGVSYSLASTTRQKVLSGLVNNRVYTLLLTAFNDSGASTSVDVSLTPSTATATVPSKVTVGTISTAVSRTLSFPYTLGSNGGSTVTRVEYTTNGGSSWSSTSTNPLVLQNLNNAQSYRVGVRAVNSIGNGTYTLKTATPVAATNAMAVQPASTMYVRGATQTLIVSYGGGTPVGTSLTTSVCSVSGLVIRALAVGTCRVTVSNSGDASFKPATPKTITLQVLAGTPTPTPTPTQSATPTPTPTSTGTTLLWSDEFNGATGSAPASTSWVANTGDGCVYDNNCGWGNGELQSYNSAANKMDGNGNLVITATRLASSSGVNCYYGACQWSSGKITTYQKVSFTYGLLEARIKVPSGGGTWPAFWTLGTNYKQVGWPSCGEQDIMEAKGSAPYTLWGTAHGNDFHIGTTTNLNEPLSAGYHVYGMAWTPTQVKFLVDGVAYSTINKADAGANPWPFGPLAGGADPKVYAIFNLAMGGAFGGSVDNALQSASMSVDWIHYSTLNGYGKVNYS